MKKNRGIIIFVGAVILLSIIMSGYFYYTIYEVREIPMILKVEGGVLGLNTDIDMINFGKLSAGDQGKRFMEISFEKKAQLVVKGEGELAEWVTISPNDAVLEPGKKERIEFIVEVPRDTREREYSGIIKFYFKRV